MNKKLQSVFTSYGTSIWIDNVNRQLLESGRLAELIEGGLRGLTSNPSIFQKAIASGDYDDFITEQKAKSLSPLKIYWEIAKKDITEAADKFGQLYQSSGGNDGFVSIEVAPDLANDTEATILQAEKLWSEINKPNLMIKVPATDAGLPAITHLISKGINVNVTLIFGPQRYKEVVDAYLAGLEKCDDPPRVSSVASVFISRVDAKIDDTLPEDSDIRGAIGVAQAVLCYEIFESKFSKENKTWDSLKQKNASLQRLLWASTSIKNESYPILKYINELLADNSVNTVPGSTLEALIQSEDTECWNTINDTTILKAHAVFQEAASAGVNLEKTFKDLEDEGVVKFEKAFTALLETIKSV